MRTASDVSGLPHTPNLWSISSHTQCTTYQISASGHRTKRNTHKATAACKTPTKATPTPTDKQTTVRLATPTQMMHSTTFRPTTASSGSSAARSMQSAKSRSSSASTNPSDLARLDEKDQWRVARAFERAAREEWGRPWANYKPRPGTESRRRVLSGLPQKPLSDRLAPLTREALVTLTLDNP